MILGKAPKIILMAKTEESWKLDKILSDIKSFSRFADLKERLIFKPVVDKVVKSAKKKKPKQK